MFKRTLLRISLFSMSFLLFSGRSIYCADIVARGFTGENFSFILAKGTDSEGVVKYAASEKPEWHMLLASRSDMLKNGGQYEVEFKVKVLGGFDPKKKFEFVVRGNDRYRQWGDICPINRFGETADFQPVRARFDIPNNGEKYKLYFFASAGTQVEVKDFVLRQGPFLREIPVTASTQKTSPELGKLPTGSEDFDVELPREPGGAVVNAADFGVSADSENNASALDKAIQHCKKIGASKLVVDKGVYKCFDEDVRVRIVGMSDFTFDGGGSTFIFRKKSLVENFLISDSTRIKLANFKVDWDWKTDPIAGVIKIIASGKSDSGEDFFDVEFVEFRGDTYPLYGKPTRVASMSPYDYSAKAVGEEDGQEACYGFRGWDKGPKTAWLSPNTMRIFTPKGSLVEGKYYRLQHFYYEGGCFAFGRVSNLTFQDIDVYSCKGAAFYAYGDCSHIQLIRANVKPPRSRRRPITSSCDHFYVTNSIGFIKLLNCEFALGGDDCFNVHGPVVYGRKIGESKLQIYTPKGVYCFRAGETAEIMDARFAPFNLSLKVKNFEKKSEDIYEIEFDGKLPEEREGGFTLFNPKYNFGNVIMRDCVFRNNRARGILLLSRNITVENCRFLRNEMLAMRFEIGYALGVWSEGVFSRNIVVRDCLFDSPNSTGTTVGGYECSIMTGAYIKNYNASELPAVPVAEDILFENNVFKNSFGLVARLMSAKTMIFKGNTFSDELPRKLEKDYRACFYITDSSDIKILENSWVKSPYAPNPRIIADSSSKNIVLWDNKIIDKDEEK